MIRKFGILGLMAGACLSLSAARAETSLVFTSWGGSTEDMQEKYWLLPFTKESGVAVQKDGPTNYGKLKAMIDTGNVAWDVVDVEADFAAKAANDGLLEPVGVDNLQKVDPRFRNKFYVGSFYFSFVLGYKGATAAHPKDWQEFFDTQKFPGKRALYKWPSPGVIEMALLADGVPADKLYPLDLDRAFRKLDTIKSSIRWWSSGAQSQQMLASGSVKYGMFWNGRVQALQDGGADVGMSWTQNITMADMLVIPRGSHHVAEAQKLIAFATGAKPQAEFARSTGYAPVNMDSIALLSPAEREKLPQAHAEGHVDPDIAYWAAHRDEIAKRWYEWQAR